VGKGSMTKEGRCGGRYPLLMQSFIHEFIYLFLFSVD